MSDEGRHGSERGRRWAVAAFVTALAPVALAPALAPDLRSWPAVTDVARISALVAVLIADLLLYVAWRAVAGPIGWLVLGLTILSIDAFTLAAMAIADTDALATHPVGITLVQIATTGGVVTLVPLAPRHALRLDPLAIGFGLGLLATLLRAALTRKTPSVDLEAAQLSVLQVVSLTLTMIAAAALLRLAVGTLAGWRLAGTWLLLSLGHTAAYFRAPPSLFTHAAVVTDTIGAALILALTARVAWAAIQDQREMLWRTRRELEQIRSSVRDDAARLHEIRATVGGLTSAAQLIRRAGDLPAARRDSIETMMEAEMDRLQRLLQGSHPSQQTVEVDLDATIEPLVVRHQLRGTPVRWRPSGERVRARRDDVAEVVNVLLENTFQHAAGAGAWIYTRRIDGTVEIAVADAGPGIDQSVRPFIFEWGERSKSSSGSGIGLNVAQQLTVELGGYLRLVDSPALGATFVLGLPAEEPS